MTLVRRILPFIDWFAGYDLPTLRIDFIAGLTVALVLVPQSMAYAQLAGLPAYFGLYAAFLPPIIASLFGSSRQLATGPVAVVSLMTSAALEPLATAGSEQYVAYAVLLALLVGAFQLVLGVLRLGLIVNFLSHPVVNGFTNAAAIIIATSQLSKIFGVTVDNAEHHYETVFRVVRAAIAFTHWPTLGMAALSFAVMITLRRANRRIPNVLVAVVATTFVAWLIGFEEKDSIDVTQIESERARASIAEFNAAVATRERIEELRAVAKRSWTEISAEERVLCSRCHDEREIDHLQAPPAGQRSRDNEKSYEHSVLALHAIAGILDERILEPKQIMARTREELRAMHFERAEPASVGKPARFYLRGEVPEGVETDGGRWRIRIGNERLETAALPIFGGGTVVGRVPEGLPSFRMPKLEWSVIPNLMIAAIIISLLGFMEAISIAKAMAARTKQKLDPNQELIGQGLGNMIGCLGQSYPVSGSFSRSAVSLQAGAVTGLSNVFSGIIVMIVLLFFSQTLYHLPQAVLASIIMMAVIGLINVSGFKHAMRTNRLDGAVVAITFFGTLYFAPHLEWGIFIGVGLSLGAYLYRAMRPKVVELVPDADGTVRSVERHGLAKCRHLVVITFEGPLNFASTSYLEGEILARVADVPELRHILVDCGGISEVDASGVETVHHLVDNLREAGYEISFCEMPDHVEDVLERSGLHDHIGAEHLYPSFGQAIPAIYPAAHAGSDEADCPFRRALPPVVELSLHPNGSLRSAARHRLKLCRHIAVLRFDAPLSFANTELLEQEVLGHLGRPGLRHVLFVSHGITRVDEAGARKLGELVETLRARQLAVSFSGLTDDVVDVLDKTTVTPKIGVHNMYPTQAVAVAAVYARSHAGSSEMACPLRPLALELTELSLHDSGVLRQARLHKLRLCSTIAVLRLDGPMVLESKQALTSEFIRWAKSRPTARTVIFVATPIHDIDERQTETLLAFVGDVREAGFCVAFAGFSDSAFEELGRSGAADEIGPENIYPSDLLAVADLYLDAHAGHEEKDCPLESVLPRVRELSVHPDGSLRDAHRHGLALCRRIVAVRFDGTLSFATLDYLAARLRQCLRERPEARHILIAAHALNKLDPNAVDDLRAFFRELHDEGYSIAVSGLRYDAVGQLADAAEQDGRGGVAFFPTQAAAVNAIHATAHAGAAEQPCPLLQAVRAEP